MSDNEKRSLRTHGGDNHDLFGAEFLGSPCHHRILKPPGGGTSDIFGGTEPSEKPIVRKKSVQTSNIILNDEPATNSNWIASPSANGYLKQGNCNARLFGYPSDGNGNIPNEGEHHSKTNEELLTNGNDHTDTPAPPTPTKLSMANGKAINGETKDGIIVVAASETPARGRVPPGGYSSGLW